jgi:hypothetical protein
MTFFVSRNWIHRLSVLAVGTRKNESIYLCSRLDRWLDDNARLLCYFPAAQRLPYRIN